jgi:hypothetical protein
MPQIPPPLSAKEMQEKLRSGEIKIVPASQDLVTTYAKECRELLAMVAMFIDSGYEPQEWADGCFFTDESSLSDFGIDDNDALALSEKIGFPVQRHDYLCQIAAKMRGVA